MGGTAAGVYRGRMGCGIDTIRGQLGMPGRLGAAQTDGKGPQLNRAPPLAGLLVPAYPGVNWSPGRGVCRVSGDAMDKRAWSLGQQQYRVDAR